MCGKIYVPEVIYYFITWVCILKGVDFEADNEQLTWLIATWKHMAYTLHFEAYSLPAI